MATKTVTPRVPIQTPMFEDDGETLTRPWVIFFEKFGTPGADGEAGTPAELPDDVTIIDPVIHETLIDDQGNEYLHVVITYNPPTPIGVFTGVEVKVEAPDGNTPPILVDVGGFDYYGVETSSGPPRYGVIDM